MRSSMAKSAMEKALAASRPKERRGTSSGDATAVAKAHRSRAPQVVSAADGLLSIVYPRKGPDGTDLRHDLSFLNVVPGLALATANGMAKAYPSKTAITTIGIAVRVLKADFSDFLSRGRTHLSPAAFNRSDLNAFKAYLDDKAKSRGRSTKARASVVHCVQRCLKKAGVFGHVEFLRNPYPGGHLSTTPRRTLPKSTLGSVLKIAMAEIIETMTLNAAFHDLDHPWRSDDRYARLLALANRLHAAFGTSPPTGAALDRFVGQRHGDGLLSIDKALSIYAPTPRALAPFAIVLMLLLRLDGQMLLDLKVSDVTITFELGIERLKVDAWRSKVGERKVSTAAVSDADDNPARLFRFLGSWSAELRRRAEPRSAEHVFIAMMREEGRGARHFQYVQHLNAALARFCNDNGLPSLTSSQPRKSAIDLADLLSGGDETVRAVAGGHSVNVSGRYYVSDEAADRHDETIGVGVKLLESVRLDGSARPAPDTYFPQEDVMSATPGWDCSNPMLGMVPGQRAGRLCSAYGMCPACELGKPDLSSAYSCARSHALLQAIERSFVNMPPALWEGIWQPVADELRNRWLPAFHSDPSVVAEAMKLDIPPMMEVVRADHD